MLLSQIVGKTVYTEKTPRGVCTAVGVSLKNRYLKYLFCTTNHDDLSAQNTNFVLSFSSVATLSADGIQLSHARPILPKPCQKLSLETPIYNLYGTYLGKTTDVIFQNGIPLYLLSTLHNRYPFASVSAIGDAILLKKVQPYPLGQTYQAENTLAPVTKSVLRKAIEEQSLIKLTLSLPPFYCSLS